MRGVIERERWSREEKKRGRSERIEAREKQRKEIDMHEKLRTE